jgi:alkanesulfonate monooxygenase SsuD/methylene tetrahydromethanopterin reductase-like flavin-dependent oxidoreductase (luciferase family)
MRFGLTTDFRNPPGSGKSSAMAYAEIIELFIWAETLGFGGAYIFEHHFTDDDYISSPMVAATAMAARTKHMRVGPDIAILPLYDPVRVAEDGAVLDLISNGRLDFGVGLGYRPQEYAGYGLDINRKGARANEALQIIRSLWQGETVTFHGKLGRTAPPQLLDSTTFVVERTLAQRLPNSRRIELADEVAWAFESRQTSPQHQRFCGALALRHWS